jgi:hypothetical protein
MLFVAPGLQEHQSEIREQRQGPLQALAEGLHCVNLLYIVGRAGGREVGWDRLAGPGGGAMGRGEVGDCTGGGGTKGILSVGQSFRRYLLATCDGTVIVAPAELRLIHRDAFRLTLQYRDV